MWQGIISLKSRNTFFLQNQQKKRVFQPKIGQFFGNFLENFQINKYHQITSSDKILGQLEHISAFYGSKCPFFGHFLPLWANIKFSGNHSLSNIPPSRLWS